MGTVSSRPQEAENIYLRDQNRFAVAGLTITDPRRRILYNITPNSFPASRYIAKRDVGDDSVIEYVQDPDGSPSLPPNFLLRLSNDDELTFNFTFIVRQTPADPSLYNNATVAPTGASVDTQIHGLTFLFASNQKELENLVTREFHADPNIHKNPNVQLIGDYSTLGNPSVSFEWSWKWKPPKTTEDKGGGWRTSCTFVEYDQRAHKLDPLATFSFFVQNTQRSLNSPKTLSPLLELPPRLRVPSSQSMDSRMSESEGAEPYDVPRSPAIEAISDYGLGLIPSQSTLSNSVKVDIACQRPAEDISQVDDGPLFRATLKALEQKTSVMRTRWKKVLKKAEAALDSQQSCNNAFGELLDALREVSTTNSSAVQPAIDHYFDKIAREILTYEKLNTVNLQKMIIDPITKLYNNDIKAADAKKKDFEDESKEYYAYLSRYLGQRQDSLKDKKRMDTDAKYQTKRRNYELKRFDYSSFMQDLNGGRKDQEVLSNLTRYADTQAKNYLATARKIEAMIPQLEALNNEVKAADKEFQLQRTEREEKRRAIEKSTKLFNEPEQPLPTIPGQTNGKAVEAEQKQRANSLAPVFQSTISPPLVGSPPSNGFLSSAGQAPASAPPSQAPQPAVSPNPNKFKGIRDLEDVAASGSEAVHGQHRKEGLLWALSRPGSHVDPKGLNKQAWHKFWVVLDQGKLSEYTNWKQKLDLHMDPIDLRVASVREARNAERRFCFEVITPHYTRVYQATSEEDMKTWIASINNALQSAVEGKGMSEPVKPESLPGPARRDIASVLTGKSSLTSSSRSTYSSSSKAPMRHATVGDRPSTRHAENDEDSAKLLQQIRSADAGNIYCADCGSDSKVEWVSINLGIVICIECSGIHRSLGTHISKVRSLTLDTTSFTPDIVEILLSIGNRVSNMVWEGRLDPAHKPSASSTREQRLRFITAKYSERAFVTPLSPTLSHYATPDETLLASIKKNDIQNVLYALALRANPNATDRSRATHAVYLALAAADPAAPGSTPTSSPLTTPRTGSPGTPASGRKPFPIAELLLQNGAELPSQPAPIPLSPSAKLYLDQKSEQRAGKRLTAGVGTLSGPHSSGHYSSSSGFSSNGAVVGGADVTGDQLTALPSISSSGNGSFGDKNKEKEATKLQKRGSTGGKLTDGKRLF